MTLLHGVTLVRVVTFGRIHVWTVNIKYDHILENTGVTIHKQLEVTNYIRSILALYYRDIGPIESS